MARSSHRLLVACLVTATSLTSWAQSKSGPAPGYPDKSIRMIVPVTAGGSTDIVARITTARMSELLGQPFVIDNRAGAGSMIGSDIVAKSAPDGYTLLMAYAPHITTPFLHKNVPYDTLRDFTPVTLVATQPLMIVVNAAVPVRSIKELVALAKAKPGQLNYGLSPAGSAGHVAGEMFKLMTGTNIVPIPYKGGAPSQAALASNEVQLIFANTLTGMAMVKAGKAVVIGVATEQRLPMFPDVPTFTEQGFPKFEVEPWQGILGPRGLPRPIVDRIHKATVEALRDPGVREKLAATGSTIVGSTPEEFDARIRAQLKSWGEVIRKSGMRGEE
jgi:tripartite-type tricarboxylate transporter receptor subunit TctC